MEGEKRVEQVLCPLDPFLYGIIMPNLPSLPPLFKNKLYKTGQTRGTDDNVIFQNRVGRNSTVLIPYDYCEIASSPPMGEDKFENGFIALISPSRYFGVPAITETLAQQGLWLGVNVLVLYETREDWRKFHPGNQGWTPATSRRSPLGGNYVARIPASTATNDSQKVIRGFNHNRSQRGWHQDI